jgi:hypothetical protein
VVVVKNCPANADELLKDVGDTGYEFCEILAALFRSTVTRFEIIEQPGPIQDEWCVIPWSVAKCGAFTI